MTEPMRDPPGGFKETEIGPTPVDWEVVLLAQAEEERAEADAALDVVLRALGLSTPFPPAGAIERGPSIPEGGASLP